MEFSVSSKICFLTETAVHRLKFSGNGTSIAFTNDHGGLSVFELSQSCRKIFQELPPVFSRRNHNYHVHSPTTNSSFVDLSTMAGTTLINSSGNDILKCSPFF